MLRGRRRMYGRKHARLNSIRLVKHLGDRRQAVGSATGIRDDIHAVPLVIQMIDPVHKRLGVFARSGNDDLFRFTHGDVDIGGVLGRQLASALENVFGAPEIPLEFCGISFAG